MSDHNPHAERLRAKPKDAKDDYWGYDPYGRAMAQIEATEAAEKKKEPCIRTLADLFEAADLEEDEVSLGDLTIADIHAALSNPKKDDKSNGRLALLAKLKDAGVAKLSHRQALATAAGRAKKDGKLRPGKATEAPVEDAQSSVMPSRPPVDAPAASTGSGASDGGSAASDVPAAAAKVDAVPFVAGQRVKLIALLSRPDLNGRTGCVVDYNAERGRFNILVQGETIALKAVNLAPAPDGAPAIVDVS